MDTLTELVNYCKTENPAGTILLTGEWGCGKTYLIEHDLKDKLKDTHVLIRISLFGISSIESLNRNVKHAWIKEKGGIISMISKTRKVKEGIEHTATVFNGNKVQSLVKTLFSVDFTDFVQVENKISGKSVVLIFDDIERSPLTIEEKLGIINEYCENQHFNVILIAAEDKIEDERYNEFKEKVVQRTVSYAPKYEELVRGIIKTIGEEKYKAFLNMYLKEIAALFAGKDLEGNSLDNLVLEHIDKQITINSYTTQEELDKQKERKRNLIKKRPHNLRSLKGAMQDFQRIYSIVDIKDLKNAQKWLFSFLAYSLSYKANLNLQNPYGYDRRLSQTDLCTLYPGFYDAQYMPDSIERWLCDGIYNELEIVESIERRCKAGSKSPLEQVKNDRIDYLDEKDATEGLKMAVPEAYEGKLTMNEYVMFIYNSSLNRHYNLFKMSIDWEKVCEGINKRIEQDITDGIDREHSIVTLKDLTDLTDEEKSAYALIDNARTKLLVMFQGNRREYIKSMKESPTDAFRKMSEKRFSSFDDEMARATVEAFDAVDNRKKASFMGYFEGMWGDYRNSYDIKIEGIEKTKKGLGVLKVELENLLKKYTRCPFKKKYTEVFVSVVERMLMDKN